eukprot:9222482-Alexandrium_andersonii.AAC.1
MQRDGGRRPAVLQDSWPCPMSSHAQQPYPRAGVTIFEFARPQQAVREVVASARASSDSCRGGGRVGA